MLLSSDLARRGDHPTPRIARQYPRWPVEFGILGPLEVRCGSDVVPIRRGLPRTILVALVLRRGHTVPSDFLVDVLWGDELPRNPANALQIQVSYLRKTLGGAEPERVHGRRDAGRRLRPAWSSPEQIDAHRFEAARRTFTPLKAVRSEAELHDALDEVERALALWRGDALEDVAGHGVRPRRDRPAGGAALGWRRNAVWTCCFGSAATATRSASSPSWSDRCRCGSDCTSSSCSPCTGRAARPTPCAPMGRPGARWWRSSASSPARTCVTWNDGSSTRTRRWTGWQPDEPTPAAVMTAVEPSPPPRGDVGPAPRSGLGARRARDEQITRLEHLLERHRAVTLTGPAGAGKTRLAIEVAARQPAAVCYVDFSPIDDPASSPRRSPPPLA